MCEHRLYNTNKETTIIIVYTWGSGLAIILQIIQLVFFFFT